MGFIPLKDISQSIGSYEVDFDMYTNIMNHDGTNDPKVPGYNANVLKPQYLANIWSKGTDFDT